jgi:hypothetical protein
MGTYRIPPLFMENGESRNSYLGVRASDQQSRKWALLILNLFYPTFESPHIIDGYYYASY